jgi:hypothetical protein
MWTACCGRKTLQTCGTRKQAVAGLPELLLIPFWRIPFFPLPLSPLKLFFLIKIRRTSDPTVEAIYGGSITDASGNVWNITSGGQIAVNGVVDTGTQV